MTIAVRYEPLPPKIYGVSVLIWEQKKYFIVIDAKQPLLNQRHTFGHELAHICLGHHDSNKPAQEIEKEANLHAWEYYRKYKAFFGKPSIEL